MTAPHNDRQAMCQRRDCGLPAASAIHMVDSKNTEIRMAAHSFVAKKEHIPSCPTNFGGGCECSEPSPVPKFNELRAVGPYLPQENAPKPVADKGELKPCPFVFENRTDEEMLAELERLKPILANTIKRLREAKKLPQGWRDIEVNI